MLATKLINELTCFHWAGYFCEILTGQAPFVEQRNDVFDETKIKNELAAAIERLESSAVDPELIQLTKDCLSYSIEHRLNNAQEVSQRLTDYVYQRDELLRESEIDRARSQTRLTVERKRRKQVVVLGTIVATFFLCTTVCFVLLLERKECASRIPLQHRTRCKRKAASKRDRDPTRSATS